MVDLTILQFVAAYNQAIILEVILGVVRDRLQNIHERITG
jgi:hypothetical protein